MHWDIENRMPFSESWASSHCGLRGARADRHPSSWWAALLGQFYSGRWRLFVSFVPQRTPLNLPDRDPASKRLKSPLLGDSGIISEGYHPVSGWLGRPPPENGQRHARNMLQSAVLIRYPLLGYFSPINGRNSPMRRMSRWTPPFTLVPLWRITFLKMVHGEAAIHIVSSMDLFTFEWKFTSSGASSSGSAHKPVFPGIQFSKRWNK